MRGMKMKALLAALSLVPGFFTLHAAEPAMRAALSKWEQQMTEYQAALKVAKTDEQRAAVRIPDGKDVAGELWRSICRKVGERDELVSPTAAERMNGAVDEVKKVPIYEFDQPWAAPAVVWFLNHPQIFAEIFNGRQRQISYYANALLESVNRTHYSSPFIADACAKLSESQSVRVYEMLQKIYTRNPDMTARANAAMAMCIMLSNPAIQGAEGSAAMARGKQLYFLRQAVTNSPEDAMFGSRSLSEAVLDMAYVLHHLSVGTIPPQLQLIGMDGQPATFPVPGKPNLIFFWAPEESVGLRVVTRQNQLAAQYPGLVFCPITVHRDLTEWKTELSRHGIVANCFMDDADNSNGLAYRVSQLPMAVLVGPDSKILFIGYPGLPLQSALDTLYADSQKAGRIIINGEAQAPAPNVQPGSQPTPRTDEAPALRDMPDDL